MDIETFVTRYYLESILQAANLRFREMSAGQVELRMWIGAGRAGKIRGLDMLVFSPSRAGCGW
jgi:exonuclease SbcC